MSTPPTQPTQPSPPRPPRPPALRWLACHGSLLLALLLMLGLYGRSVGFPFVNWDDPLHVYRNPAIVAPQTLTATERWLPRSLGYPMPLTIASYRLDRALWVSGERPALAEGRGFHLTNFVLSLLLVGLFYALALRALSERLTAGIATLFFAAHPLLAEPVCWISGRKDLLMAVFVLASLQLWLTFLERGRGRWALLFALTALAALASKPTAVALLPLALYLAVGERARWPAGRPRWPLWAVLVLLAAVVLVVTVIGWQWNRAVGGVQALPAPMTLLRRAEWGLGFHLSLVVAPFSLTPKYIVEPGAFGGFDVLGLGAVFSLALLLWRLRARPRHPAALGAALFASAYLPVSSLIPLTRYLADVYLLLPLGGLALLLGAGLSQLRHRSTPHFFRTVLAVALLCIVGLALISWRQALVWSSSPRLWRHQQAHYEDPKNCRMLGQAQNELGQHRRALATYQRCARRYGLTLMENNIALTYFFLGRYDLSAQHFRQILQRKPGDRRALKYLRLIGKRVRPTPR